MFSYHTVWRFAVFYAYSVPRGDDILVVTARYFLPASWRDLSKLSFGRLRYEVIPGCILDSDAQVVPRIHNLDFPAVALTTRDTPAMSYPFKHYHDLYTTIPEGSPTESPILTTAAIVGISVMAIFFVAITSCFCCCVACRRRSTMKRQPSPSQSNRGIEFRRPSQESPPPPLYSTNPEQGKRIIDHVSCSVALSPSRLEDGNHMPTAPPPAYRQVIHEHDHNL
ncbi:hypothetical protein BKA67DRAFT_531830 [Truncatella angustata]|uniref:Uncharacterized protein n=1 Tax=Truncatella angustata TaxID=152316 RepID=A0A9P8UQX5_9PEZI|nr:uncharacterized protein BKA67DRAFT_531830 [Truncatella angustata]KAH6656566.1 hypothetical protein BKA67DRAFT_531830 [Truncatella angustata]